MIYAPLVLVSQAVESSITSMPSIRQTILSHWRRLDASWRFALVAFVAARLFFALWSWVIFIFQPIAVQNFELGGEPILSVFNLENSDAHVYRRDVDGKALSFRAADNGQLIDEQTGSLWEISTGASVAGPLQGAVLAAAQTTPDDLFPYHGITPYPGRWLGVWQRFDANWYLSIAERGYGYIPGDVHFPPLYPILMRLLRPIFRDTFISGIFIASIATLYALKLLHELFYQWGYEKAAHRALLLFLLYPTFFFCMSAYTEPLFLVTALLSLRSMQSRNWGWAGFWTFCAILVRLQGVALLAPMAYSMWRDTSFLRKPAHWAGSILAGNGALVYLYVRAQSETQEAIPLVEADLHARLVPPWQSYWYAVENILVRQATFIDILNWSIVTLVAILLVWGWNKIPLEFTIYTAAALLVIMTRMVETQPLVSMARYSLTFFPIFFWMALIGEHPVPRRLIVYASLLLSLYLSGQFLLWGWVA
jgi:hypothetical protein